MKSVLITNLYFAKYTGSELHTLEIGRLFQKKGYDVTIAVFQKAYPLLEQAGSMTIVDCLNEELDKKYYDIIFVQHYPVFDFLFSKYKISYDKIVVSKLSVINDLEYLPVCTSKADMILCVSDECAEQVYKEIGHDKRVKVFKNSISAEWFEHGITFDRNRQLKKIAIISNHVPKELVEFSTVMGPEYEIDYVGAEYMPKLVDAELLKEYDLIITIGRTVQQCFALKVPVYVYDYFGGPGYIDEGNFKTAEFHNFSGRGGFERKTAEEIKVDIVANYKSNLERLNGFFEIAKDEYNYDKNFEEIFIDLMKEENEEKTISTFFSEEESLRMMTYCRAIVAHRLPQSIISQLYIDYGEGFLEEESIKWSVSDNYIISKTYKFDKSIKKFRFDPCNVPAECYIYEVKVNGRIKPECCMQTKRFLHYDPQFVFELSEEEQKSGVINLEINYRFRAENLREASMLMYDKVLELESENLALQNNVEIIREYYKLTPKNIAKRILGVFKR